MKNKIYVDSVGRIYKVKQDKDIWIIVYHEKMTGGWIWDKSFGLFVDLVSAQMALERRATRGKWKVEDDDE